MVTELPKKRPSPSKQKQQAKTKPSSSASSSSPSTSTKTKKSTASSKPASASKKSPSKSSSTPQGNHKITLNATMPQVTGKVVIEGPAQTDGSQQDNLTKSSKGNDSPSKAVSSSPKASGSANTTK